MWLSRDETNNLHYFCSLIELISRETDNSRAEIIAYFTLEDIKEELNIAEVNLCLPIERVVDEYIASYGIAKGSKPRDPEFCKSFRYHQIGYILMTYIASLVENDGYDIAMATQHVLSSSLSRLFDNME